MSFIQLKPGTLLSPVPAALVSVGREKEGKIEVNALAIAWTGVVNSDPPMVSISIQPKRYSYDFVKQTGEFVVNLVSEDMLRGLDYCGVRSGRDENKLEKCGLTPIPAQNLTYAPAIAQAPVYLGCKVEQSLMLGSHECFIGKVVSVGVQDDLMDENGKVSYGKAHLVAYNHGDYWGLSRALGFFGFSVASPDVLKRRMKELR